MATPLRPQLRPVEIIPPGPEDEPLFVLRDPEGFSRTVRIPYAGMLLAVLMDGQNTLAQVQAAFQEQVGAQIPLANVEQLVGQLDEAYLLVGERFEKFRQEQIDKYLAAPVRPAAHAGESYVGEPKVLREQLDGFFTCRNGPGTPQPGKTSGSRRLRGIVSPHIDLYRGGAAFAWAYNALAEQSDADLFVIFGTAHTPMKQWFGVSRKDFDTPLGIVHTDVQFIERLSGHLASSVAGRQIDLFDDELVHRCEHSIEFQVLFLKHVLGAARKFSIVPVLARSFEEFLQNGMHPDESPEIQAFVAAMRQAESEHAGRVCYISGADLAHVGRRFGDDWLVDQRRQDEQSEDDRRLLEAACGGDGTAFFGHVAGQDDRSRICGLSPTYTMLQVVHPVHGELLAYEQAVEPDGSSCVTFAAMAFYGE